MCDLRVTQQIIALKFSRVTSDVNIELKTNVPEISTVSIIRVDVVNEWQA
jgi:hypothetical protein